MGEERNAGHKIWKTIRWIGVGGLCVCNIITALLFLSIKSQLNEHNEVLLTLPPELQDRIFQMYHQASEGMKREIIADSKDAVPQIVESAVEQILASLDNKEKQKVTAYLNAARRPDNKPEVTQLLYISALNFSDDKAVILHEFIDWKSRQIDQALSENDTALAQEHFAELANIYASALNFGSVSDMAAMPELSEKLSLIAKSISAKIDEKKSADQITVTSFKLRADNIRTYEDAENLLRDLASLQVDSSFEDQIAQIEAEVILKQSCLTMPVHPVMIPVVSENTPYEAWLRNFINRLKSDLLVEKKLEDIGRVAEFIQVVKEQNFQNKQDLLAELERTSRCVYLAYWRENAGKLVASENPDLNQIANLLAESTTFSDAEKNECRSEILRLNHCIINASLLELEKTYGHLRVLENTVANKETYMQMVSITQGQYVSMLMKLTALEAEFSGKFSSQIDMVKRIIGGLQLLIDAYRDELAADEVGKLQAQRNRFQAWAENEIATAESSFNQAKAWAGEWGRTWYNNDVREYCAGAWLRLMSIHEGDLREVNPALHQRWSTLKSQIEAEYTPTPHVMKQVSFKRITDF